MPPEGLRGVAQPALFAHLAALAGDQAQVAEAMAEVQSSRKVRCSFAATSVHGPTLSTVEPFEARLYFADSTPYRPYP